MGAESAQSTSCSQRSPEGAGPARTAPQGTRMRLQGAPGQGCCRMTTGPTRWQHRAGAPSERLWGGVTPRPGLWPLHGAQLHILISSLPRLQTPWEGKAPRGLERALSGSPKAGPLPGGARQSRRGAERGTGAPGSRGGAAGGVLPRAWLPGRSDPTPNRHRAGTIPAALALLTQPSAPMSPQPEPRSCSPGPSLPASPPAPPHNTCRLETSAWGP